MKKPSVALFYMLASCGYPVGKDKNCIPPQPEEYKNYYLAKAEAKRNRRREARLYRKKWRIE